VSKRDVITGTNSSELILKLEYLKNKIKKGINDKDESRKNSGYFEVGVERSLDYSVAKFSWARDWIKW
jgi:hypothetical protein